MLPVNPPSPASVGCAGCAGPKVELRGPSRGRRGCAPGRQMTSLKRGAAFAASGVNGRVAPALRRVSFAFASGCG